MVNVPVRRNVRVLRTTQYLLHVLQSFISFSSFIIHYQSNFLSICILHICFCISRQFRAYFMHFGFFMQNWTKKPQNFPGIFFNFITHLRAYTHRTATHKNQHRALSVKFRWKIIKIRWFLTKNARCWFFIISRSVSVFCCVFVHFNTYILGYIVHIKTRSVHYISISPIIQLISNDSKRTNPSKK